MCLCVFVGSGADNDVLERSICHELSGHGQWTVDKQGGMDEICRACTEGKSTVLVVTTQDPGKVLVLKRGWVVETSGAGHRYFWPVVSWTELVILACVAVWTMAKLRMNENELMNILLWLFFVAPCNELAKYFIQVHIYSGKMLY